MSTGMLGSLAETEHIMGITSVHGWDVAT